jgi:hypothetical protein
MHLPESMISQCTRCVVLLQSNGTPSWAYGTRTCKKRVLSTERAIKQMANAAWWHDNPARLSCQAERMILPIQPPVAYHRTWWRQSCESKYIQVGCKGHMLSRKTGAITATRSCPEGPHAVSDIWAPSRPHAVARKGHMLSQIRVPSRPHAVARMGHMLSQIRTMHTHTLSWKEHVGVVARFRIPYTRTNSLCPYPLLQTTWRRSAT